MWLPSLFIFALLSTGQSPYCQAHPAKRETAKVVDFCNFSYPGIRNLRTGKRVWPAQHFTLTRGAWQEAGDEPYARTVTLENIEHADLTGAGRKSAITTLRWHSGGSLQKGLVYIWGSEAEKPTLLWSFAAGDRSDGGLHNVYSKNGDLFVELNDPDAAIGSCCSRRFIRKRYHWNGGRFELVGKPVTVPNHEYDNVKD